MLVKRSCEDGHARATVGWGSSRHAVSVLTGLCCDGAGNGGGGSGDGGGGGGGDGDGGSEGSGFVRGWKGHAISVFVLRVGASVQL